MYEEGLRLVWYWAFCTGAFGAFILRFLKFKKNKKNITKTRILMKNVFGLSDIINYLIAGSLSFFLGPITPIQGLIFGATWEGIFKSLIDKYDTNNE